MREGINKGVGIHRYKLLYIKQKTNKDLLYSTGNYIQYLAITYNGIYSEKKLNHFVVYLKLMYTIS